MRPLAGQAEYKPVANIVGTACGAIAAFWYELFPTLGPALADRHTACRIGAHLHREHLGPERGVAAIAGYLQMGQSAGRLSTSSDVDAIAQAAMGAAISAAIEGLLSGKRKAAVRSDATRRGGLIAQAALGPNTREPQRGATPKTVRRPTQPSQ
jgi:hypothetical protein